MTEAPVPTDAQTACFEAGIKFGTLYHQFAGTPVSPTSADSLARAMAEAVENQPHCVNAVVDIREDDLRTDLAESTADYAELTGRFMDVDMKISYEGITVHTRMRMSDGYPLMEIVDVRS